MALKNYFDEMVDWFISFRTTYSVSSLQLKSYNRTLVRCCASVRQFLPMTLITARPPTISTSAAVVIPACRLLGQSGLSSAGQGE